jgi:hypothetical protein
MIDPLKPTISTRVHGDTARSLKDIPDVAIVLNQFKLNLEGVRVWTLAFDIALRRDQYEA